MFNFLRNHQRKFLIVITIMLVSSFIFFGTFSAFIQPKSQEMPDREVVTGLGGKPLMKKELQALRQMLATSAMNAASVRKAPNLFNDGVIEKELLTSGMSLLLAEKYFTQLKPDLEMRLKKMQHYRHYAHPQAPHISAFAVWQRFAPQLLQHLERLKKQGDACTLDTFALMVQLYLDQTALSPEILKQILLFQQQQQGVAPDPQLAQADLSLFGFASLEEWFGPLFVELSAQFIANAAYLAEEKGYDVKTDEIRTELLQNIFSGYKRIAHSNSSISNQEIHQYFQRKPMQWGFDEKVLLGTWRKVMLFRRLFADVGGSVLIDSLAYQHFQEFSQHQAKIELYEMPASLQLRDFQMMLKLQVYIEGIASHPQELRTQLVLPSLLSSNEQIEKRFPELVERDCEVEYAETSITALAREISLKETWDWEAVDGHWEILQKQFSELDANAKGREQRLAILDSLDAKRRLAVDTYARHKIIEETPYKIVKTLDTATMQKAKIGLRLQGGSLPFSGVEDRSRLVSLLETAAISNEGDILEAQDPLYCFSADKEHYYRIKVLQRDDAKHVLSFAEALADGTLDALLNRRLEEAYPEVRKKNPGYFQVDKGNWKPLKEVKDHVGRYVFGDLLKAIEESYKAHLGPLPGNPGELPLVFYSNYRLFSHMREAELSIQLNDSDPSWVKVEDQQASLSEQWLLGKTQRVIKRCDSLGFSKEEMFALPPQQWSSVKLGSGGALAFYKVLEQDLHAEFSPDQIKQGQEILALDARKQLMRELIALIDRKQAIDITQISGSEIDEY